MINTVICGDNLDIMRGMADNSVDLVITSPPYEDARTYDIDFKLQGQDWVDWAIPRFTECVRICKGLVAWVVEGKTRKFRYSAAPILLMADLHRAGIHLRKPPIFHRVGIPGSGGPDWLRNDYELIVCATSSGKLPWSDNTACGHPPKFPKGGEVSHRMASGRRVNQLRNNREQDGSIRIQGYVAPKKANPGNVLKCNVGKGHMGSNLAHESEAPFPESLAEFFIKSFCPPNGIVLDPFSGSGTSLKVAGVNGRKYIGIDVRESQCDLSGRRIEEIQSERSLFQE